MNLIQRELKRSEKYHLDTEEIDYNGKNVTIVKLTSLNVAKVEAMIRNDSAYLKCGDRDRGPKGKYGGSSAYWLSRLISFFNNEEDPENFYSYDELIRQSVFAIDRENSTHLNSDRIGRNIVVKRILDIKREDLIEELKNPVKNKYSLITKIQEKSEDGKSYFSFATKFCHYVCFYLFEGKKEQDNFSIFDNVLGNALPKYMEKYNIDKINYKKNYINYIKTIDMIRDKVKKETGENISRNGFDHLLWYYHKGRD